MSFERPNFYPKNNQEEIPASEEILVNKENRSNVIEGPWPKKETKIVEQAAEPGPVSPDIPDNVVEGPWPKTFPERDKPEEGAAPESAQEPVRAPVEAEILKSTSSEEQKESPEPHELEENEKKRLPFVEMYTEYKRCEACGGKGRRWFLIPCRVCKGRGSIPTQSSRQEGYYEDGKKVVQE